jgi:hypothetical protein
MKRLDLGAATPDNRTPEPSPRSGPRSSSGDQFTGDGSSGSVPGLSETPRTPRPASAQTLHWREKFLRAVSNAARIGQGLLGLERKGIKGKILGESSWPEVFDEKHRFVGKGEFKGRFEEWKNSKTQASFPEWLKARYPELSDAEKEQFRHFGLWDDEDKPIEENRVQYLTPGERKAHQIDFQAGASNVQLLAANRKPLDTTQLARTGGYHEGCIFVIAPDETLYVGPDILARFHHSSFLSGGALLWAGEIKTNQDGEITYLKDESGHYKPTPEQAINGLAVLQKRGVNLSKVTYECYTDGKQYRAADYLSQHSRTPPVRPVQ